MNNIPIDLIIKLVIFGLFIGVPVVTAILKEVKKLREKNAAAPGEEASEQIDEAAARRRAELRELARTRMQAGGSAPSQAGAEPANLSMAERIARARAKEQYRARAEGLRQQAPQASAEAERQRELAALQRAEAARRAQREAELARQREAVQRRLEEQQRQQLRRADRSSKPSRPQPIQPPPRPVEQRRPAKQHVEHTQERDSDRIAQQTLLGTAPASQVSPGGGRTAQASPTVVLRGQSLREAFILKEILDAPVSLRAPEPRAF